MSVSAETYIVISLMFAVFAAVAAVGTSVVLGAGFERLRAGFELVKRQSGFFSDAIYKLDQRTQKLDEEQAKLKAGVYSVNERMDRVEKQVTFMGDAVNSIEQRILQGSPAQQPAKTIGTVHMHTVHTVSRKSRPEVQAPTKQPEWISVPMTDQRRQPAQPQQPHASLTREEPVMTGMFRDFPEEAPVSSDLRHDPAHTIQAEEREEASASLTTLLSRYFTGEQSGSGKTVVYH